MNEQLKKIKSREVKISDLERKIDFWQTRLDTLQSGVEQPVEETPTDTPPVKTPPETPVEDTPEVEESAGPAGPWFRTMNWMAVCRAFAGRSYENPVWILSCFIILLFY